MSLESNIAALVAASTGLTQAVNITKATVEATRDSAIAKEAPVTIAKDAVLASTTAATTDATTTGSKLTAVAADYATQKTTKGLAAVQTDADSELKDRLHRRDPARHPFRGARPSLVMDFVRRECHRNNAAGNLEPVDLNTFMTFTRGSTATYVGPDGLIKEAAINTPRYGYDPVTGEALGLLVEEQRTNLVTYSIQFALAMWTKTGVSALANTIISPAGDLTGGTVSVSTAAQSNIATPVTIVAGVVYTTSVYVKAGNTNVVTIRLERGPTVLANADITLGTSAEAVHVGNGWYRCTIISTASDGTNGGLLVYPGGRRTQSVGDYVYVWGAQLEAGAFPTSYIPTTATFTGRASTKTYFDSNGVMQTAANDVAVTDHGYVDGRWVSKGLSLEPQATNVASYSSGSNTSGYDSDSTTSVNATTVSGVGLNNFVSTAGFRRRISWFGATLGTGNVVVSLFVAKQTGSVTLGFAPWEGSVGNATTVALDMGTGVGVLTKGSHTTAALRVEDCGSLWRVSVALTYLSGTVTLGTFYFISTLTSLTLGGLQAETGPVATSYIPTTTAQVTRAADTSTSAQVTRAKDWAIAIDTNWFNNDAGTFSAIAKGGLESSQGGYGRIISGGTAACVLGRDPLNGLQSWDGVTVVKNSAGGLLDANFIKGGTAYSLNYRAVSCNGAAKVSGTFSSFNIKGAGIGIGSFRTNGDNCLNGYIKQLTYFPRQLSDADLQALTILED